MSFSVPDARQIWIFVVPVLVAAIGLMPLAGAQTLPAYPPPYMQNIIIIPPPIGRPGPMTVIGTPGAPVSGRPAPVSAFASPQAAKAASTQAAASTNSCGSAQPQEVVALARALKNDPDLIYEYVYNNIDTLPQFGSLKGVLGTLIDRSGTPVDQADLMVALLQQSGNCTASFVTGGGVTIDPVSLKNWLGADTSTAGFSTNQQSIGGILATGGFTDPNGGGAILVNYNNLNQISAQVDWTWVQVSINGTNFVFDPASPKKFAARAASIPSLANAIGYSQPSFLAAAENGASVNATAVSGLNRSNVRSQLQTYAGNLNAYLKSTPAFAAASPAAVLGQRVITPLAPATAPLPPTFTPVPPQRLTTLPNQAGSPTVSTTLPAALRTVLTVTLPGSPGPIAYNSSDIYGHRLSVFFDGSITPTLRLDGATQATGSVAANGAQVTLTTTIKHPFSTTSADVPSGSSQSTVIKVNAAPNGAFVIETGWGQVSRSMIEKHRTLLQQAQAQYPNGTTPGQPGYEAVMGESLAMLGYTWLAENARVEQLVDSAAGTSTIYQHAVGVVGLKPVGSLAGPFVDLPINLIGGIQASGRPSTKSQTPIESAAFYADAAMSSVLESGSIEQTQPAIPAASTVKLLDTWAQSGSIYNINDNSVAGDDCNYYKNSIRSLLTNYQAGDLLRIDGIVGYYAANGTCTAGGARVVAPSNGAITIGQYTGAGYFQIAQDGTGGVGSIITGGLSGGVPGGGAPTPTLVRNTATQAPPPPVSPAITSAGSQSPNNSVSAGTGGDPLNLVTGAYDYSHDDLTIGSRAFPYGLGFQRSYDSSRTAPSALGTGWTHNFALTALPNSDGFAGMAETSASQGTTAIAALYVLQDILNAQSSNAKPLDRMIIGVEIERFVMDALTNNVIAVTQPGLTESFVKLADGSFAPPAGTPTTLSNNAGAGPITYRTKDGTQLVFDQASGHLNTWSSPAGMTVSLAYAGANLQTVSNNLGRTLTLTYTGSQITSVSDGQGRSIGYGYTGNNATSFVDALGQTTTFAYDASGRLTQLFYPSRPTNAFVTNTYDAAGRVYQQADAFGHMSQSYFAGTRTEFVNPVGGRQVTYFDGSGRTLASFSVSDVAGRSDQIPASAFVFGLTTFQRDGLGRVTRATLEEGNASSYTYDASSNVLTETQTPKPGSLDNHPGGGALAARTRNSTYEPVFNHALTTSDFAGNVTNFGYDSAGNLKTIDQPAVAKPGNGTGRPHTAFTYDAHGLPLTTTDPEGLVTASTYDANGNLTKVVVDSGRLNLTTQFGYDAFGNRNSVIDPNTTAAGGTASSTVTYDALRRVAQTTPLSPFQANITKYAYDPDGRVTSVQRASGSSSNPWQTVSTTYTLSGQVATATDPSGNVTTYTYDGADRLSTVTDGEGRVSSNCWVDAIGFVKAKCKGPKTNTTQQAIFYDPTPNGLVSTRYGQNATRTFYDGFDRPSQLAYALDQGAQNSEYYAYAANSDDRDYKKTRAGQAVKWTYDALHRQMTKNGPDQSITYGYDYAGRLITAATPVVAGDPSTGQFTLWFDSAGRPFGELRPDGKYRAGRRDANGNQTEIELDPATGGYQYKYDQLNRFTGAVWEAHSGLWDEQIDMLDRVTARFYYENGGWATSYGYIGNDVLAGNVFQVLGNSTSTYAPSDYIYTYNHARQVVSQTFAGSAVSQHATLRAGTRSFANNGLDETTGETGTPGGTVTYNSDVNGNATGAAGGAVFAYDGEGEGRLLSVTVGGVVTNTYRYDALGRRAVEIAGSRTVVYVHDALGRELAEYDGAGNILRRNIFGPRDQAPVAVVGASGTIVYNHLDALGSVIATSSNGAVASQTGYDPTGNTTQVAGPFGYAGGRSDYGIGYVHFGARDYNPGLGRFISPDPIGYAGGNSLYAYVGNDPLNLTDPSGLCAGNGCGNANPANQLIQNDAITPVYPLEYAIGAVTGGSALRTLGGAVIRQFLPDPAPVSPPPPNTQGNPFGIPDNFTSQPSQKGGGTIYVDPANPSYNRVRVMPGNPNSPNPAQQNPYVIDLRNGQAIDVNGTRLPSTSDPAAHIPQSQYQYRP